MNYYTVLYYSFSTLNISPTSSVVITFSVTNKMQRRVSVLSREEDVELLSLWSQREQNFNNYTQRQGMTWHRETFYFWYTINRTSEEVKVKLRNAYDKRVIHNLVHLISNSNCRITKYSSTYYTLNLFQEYLYFYNHPNLYRRHFTHCTLEEFNQKRDSGNL